MTITTGKMLRSFIIGICLITFLIRCSHPDEVSKFDNFIHREGACLYDGEKPFRFISFNVPNLLCIEDNMPFTETNPWRLPDKFEIEDALKTIGMMGGKVVRTYTITVKRRDDEKGIFCKSRHGYIGFKSASCIQYRGIDDLANGHGDIIRAKHLQNLLGIRALNQKFAHGR